VQNPQKSTYLGTLFFILGYFLIWVLFCIVMTSLQWQLHAQALLTPMMESRNKLFSALILMLAGYYQVNGFKAFCLAHCRESHYLKDDCHSRPIVRGLHHGLYCVGACWALMLIPFAVGVMNLFWMELITAIVVLEKIFPPKPVYLDAMSGFALVMWGAYLLAPPEWLSWYDLFLSRVQENLCG
jgi:predicted metal-binding membrane protein